MVQTRSLDQVAHLGTTISWGELKKASAIVAFDFMGSRVACLNPSQQTDENEEKIVVDVKFVNELIETKSQSIRKKRNSNVERMIKEDEEQHISEATSTREAAVAVEKQICKALVNKDSNSSDVQVSV
ncbi:hypothetical protein F3Y22_tig00007204pilonHSYRG00011 [Hibiscus syriacus]|uniref:Uncharacterized protein n=1 Tax=Hibiscus syriacus TaxID=106335 RepID=A0A6A3CAF5_HIBSY|nr:hypothetical protein F3Y22_tig00007204pilonHSYRG00011 [Hibiscus syriacus]